MTTTHNQSLQRVTLGRMESPTVKCRPFAVWDGPKRVAENLTRSEALAMLAGMCWSEEGRKLGPYTNAGHIKHARWNFAE